MVGGEARRGTTLTEQVSVSESPARMGDESNVVIVATGGGRPEMGGEGWEHHLCHMTHLLVTVRVYTPCVGRLVRMYSELMSDPVRALQV